MKSQSGVDLSLVSGDEIWEELKLRYDGVVLSTIKNMDEKSEGIQISFYGGKALCMGLCEHTKDKILEEMRGRTELKKL